MGEGKGERGEGPMWQGVNCDICRSRVAHQGGRVTEKGIRAKATEGEACTKKAKRSKG